MPLTRFERKARLRHGDVGRVAAECGCSLAYASEVLADKGGSTPLARKVQIAFARRMKLRVADAFGEMTVPLAPTPATDVAAADEGAALQEETTDETSETRAA